MEIIIIKFKLSEDLNNNKLSEIIKNEYTLHIHSVINSLLNISKVEINEELEFIVAEDFDKEVLEFQKLHNISLGFTENVSNEKTWAITLDYKTNKKYNVAIIINKFIFWGLFNKDNFQKSTIEDFCINTIHHELMHAYDFYKSSDLYNYINNYNKDCLKNELLSISCMVWKEYYATRMSSITFKEGNYIDEFHNQILEFNNRINIIKEVNKKCGNIDKMYGDIRKILVISLRFTSYYFGNLFSLGEYEEICDLVEQSYSKFNNSFIQVIYKELFVELNKLFEIYPELTINDFEYINSLINDVYKFLGISLISNDNQSYNILILSNF